jgi:hypothetical protein
MTLNRPVIDVVRADTGKSVKTVDRTDGGAGEEVLILDDTKPLVVGVYLPSTFEGLVRVDATFHGAGCRWHGTSPAVPVHPDQTASTTVTMTPDEMCTPAPTPDGGVTDGGDASDVSDAKPTLVPDASDGPPQTLAMKCSSYCRAYADACLTPESPESSTCMGWCLSARWDDGMPTSAPENTFACRWDHLKVVTNDAALSCSECYAASPSSPGVCGPAGADAGARDACPPTD